MTTIVRFTAHAVNVWPLQPLFASPPASLRMDEAASLSFDRADGPLGKSLLIERVREAVRLRRYSVRTEHAYCTWILRYLRFNACGTRAS